MKICGITSEEDGLLSVAMGADAVGFNFVAGSKRQIAPERARDIARRLPAEIMTVGILRDTLPERVIELTQRAGLRAAQLHGRETAEQTRAVRSRVPIVIKAFSAGDPGLGHLDEFGADVVMIDGAEPGSGEVFDWGLAEDAPTAGHRVVLAGGLRPDNVGDAIDFANEGVGSEMRFAPEVALRLGRQVELGLTHTYQRLDRAVGSFLEQTLPISI